MPAETKTVEDLKTVLVGLQEGIKTWTQTYPFQENNEINNNNNNDTHNDKDLIKSAKLEQPLTELIKLCKLVKAHTTKIGIVYKPPISEKNYIAAYNTTRELSSCVVLLISVLSQLIKDGESGYYTIKLQFELKRKTLNLLSNIDSLFIELFEIVENNETENEKIEEIGSNRLMSIGKIWDSADKLIELANGGNTGSIKIELDSCNFIIKDAKIEFEEWLEDPQIDDDDDPFGLNDKFSDDESDNDDDNVPNDNDKHNDKSDDDDNERTCFIDGSDSKIKPSYLKSAENWLQKLKLIYFLISNIKSYLPLQSNLESNIITQETRLKYVKILNNISKLSLKLPEIIDEAIDELTQGYYTEEINARLLKDLNNISQELINGLKVLNKGNKVKLDKIDEFYTKWNKLIKELN